MTGKRVVDTGDQLAQLAFPADEDTARALLLGPREVEARVLAEDRLVELPEPAPRLDASSSTSAARVR